MLWQSGPVPKQLGIELEGDYRAVVGGPRTSSGSQNFSKILATRFLPGSSRFPLVFLSNGAAIPEQEVDPEATDELIDKAHR